MDKVSKLLPELTGKGRNIIQGIMQNLCEKSAFEFAEIYRKKRVSAEKIMLLALLGYILLAGVHYFYLKNYSMGFKFLFSFGLFFIGTTYDISNAEDLAFEFNRKLAFEMLHKQEN